MHFHVDHEIGRLFEFLHTRGLAEDTIVVLSADHGDMTASDGGLMDKGLLYQEAHRIPLIFYWKDKWASGNREDLSLNMDIMPTLMDLCGLDIPAGLDGLRFLYS